MANANRDNRLDLLVWAMSGQNWQARFCETGSI